MKNRNVNGVTEPIKPVEEKVTGINVPYRGMVNHGVPSIKVEDSMPELDYASMADSIIDEHQNYEQTPLPVRVVQEHNRNRRQWRTMRYVVNPNEPMRIVGEQESRIKFRIRSTGEISLAHSPELCAMHGYVTSSEIEMLHIEDVWCVATTATVTVYVMVEYEVGVPNV